MVFICMANEQAFSQVVAIMISLVSWAGEPLQKIAAHLNKALASLNGLLF